MLIGSGDVLRTTALHAHHAQSRSTGTTGKPRTCVQQADSVGVTLLQPNADE